MKYPQLVSTRAVNAISDWLVSRLEQLGVEAPLIYSRLLLSLLQSSVQINDPIEFNNLETFLANRKGYKRYPSCDTDTLKKIAAVQCLMDTVSSEQEITKIENLVDELCEKLSDIEKQMTNEDDTELIENSDLSTSSTAKEQLAAALGKLTDIEDPTKRYFTAFPALSKDMEDSVRIIKRNTKALTWPFYRNSSTDISIVNSQANTVHCNTAGVKRKTKRRRNQAMSKGKLLTNPRKNSYEGNSSPTWDTDFEGTWEMGRDLIKEFKQNTRNRSTSESAAYNLRRSGFEHENREKRMKPMTNDDNAEDNDEMKNETIALSSEPMIIPDINVQTQNAVNVTSSVGVYGIDIPIYDENMSFSFKSNALAINAGEGSHENLTSLSEITDGSLNVARRLYERDISNDSLNNTMPSTEQNDIAQFKAKFNSSVEALWKTDKPQNTDTEMSSLQINPNQNSLDNFWTNYYNHHYNVEKFITNSQSLMNNNNNNTVGVNNNNMMINDGENEFFSMPSYLERSNKNLPYHNDSPAGLFLLDPIWAGNINKNYSDDEDSFYSKVISSFTFSTEPKNTDENAAFTGSEEKAFYNPFKSSKWSEGINGVSSLENKVTTTPSMTSIDSDNLNWAKHDFEPPIDSVSFQSMYNRDNYNQLSQKVQPTLNNISLSNHSVSSGFVEYSLIKPISKQENPTSTVSSSSTNIDSIKSNDDDEVEGENLLTAERTHFHPINSFADGHSFDISSQLEDINYERSQSGYFYFESDKYLEYNSFDGFVSEDSVSLFSSISSTTSLSCSEHLDDSQFNMPANNGFVIKFRLQNTDIACQTDPSINSSSSDYVIEGHIRNINEEKLNKLEYIASQKELVNISDSAAFDTSFELPSKCVGEKMNSEASVNLIQWSMAEIGKKCVDNNNTTHTLWGMCPACNNDMKSVPANRLLKEELDLEGDEIMSDLKYMQDLNIGSDWGDDEDADTDLDAETIRDSEYYQSISSPDGCASGELDDVGSGVDDHRVEKIYNVKKLISDLLKLENEKSLAMAWKGAVDAINKRVNNQHYENIQVEDDNNNNENFVSGIWCSNENVIWKNEFKPMDLLTHLNNNDITNKAHWKYANLAELWNNTSPGNQPLFDCHSDCNWSTSVSKQYPDNEETNLKFDDDYQYNKSQIKTTISKNLKNLLPSCEGMPTPSSYESTNDIIDKNKFNESKRIQNCYSINNKHAGSFKIHNRFDRKRRHSASQNLSCINNNNDYSASNNNNTTSCYLNRPKCDLLNQTDIKLITKFDQIFDDDTMSSTLMYSPDTMITCKYWTTLEPTQANDSVTAAINPSTATIAKPFFAAANFSTMAALNTSSILKHVTLVSTRPLTR